MSRLPLTPAISCATFQLLTYVLRNKLVPRPFRALRFQTFWTQSGIFLLLSWHQQAQKEVGRFFWSFAEFVFQLFCDSRSFFSNRFFVTWSYRYLNPNASSSARLRFPLTHRCFFGTTSLCKPLPRFVGFLAHRKSPNLRTEIKCLACEQFHLWEQSDLAGMRDALLDFAPDCSSESLVASLSSRT